MYLERRRNTQVTAAKRRESERRRVVRELEDGNRNHSRDQPRERIRNATIAKANHDHGHRDQRPRNSRHGNVTTRYHHIDKHSHRHGDGCGHHFYDNRWHDYPRQHRHYDGCGHYHHSGSWISFSIGHVHGFGCGHFYDNGIWLSYSGSIHRHHIGCGHFYYDGFWHNTSCYHIHGPGCGHYYYDNHWNDFPRTHVHTDYCEHMYDGSRWLIVSSDTHVHSANCGHYQFSGHWYAYPRSYYTMNREDSLYFFVDLGDYRNRNIPDWAYQEYFDDSSPVDIFRSSNSLAKAYAAFAKGRYYDSLVQFKTASKQYPQNALIHLAQAQAQIAVKDYRSAFDDIVRGMELFPEWADAYVNLSEIYSNTEDLEQHSLELTQWVERYPRDFKAHFVLGYFYYFHQEYDAAKDELLYALSWDEDLKPAQILMDKILEFEAEAEVLTIEEEASPEEEAVITTE